MLAKEKHKTALGLIIIFSIIFEVTFFFLFFADINLIGEINPSIPFSADYGIFLTVIMLVSTIILLTTGLHFAQTSKKSETKEIRLKGKLLQAAFIMFSIASVLEKTARSIMIGIVFQDPTEPLLLVMLAVVRVVLILSAFAFYGGFLLPRWMKELFLKEE
jgi:hypothetical protein